LATLDNTYHADPGQLIDVTAPEPGHTVTVAAGQSVTSLDFSNVQLGAIHGRNFRDANANRVHDAGKEFLNGWTIELLDALGNLVAVQQTHDVDLDEDGKIDAATERGWYRFDELEPGLYFIREIFQDGWQRTAPVDVLAQVAFDIGQQFDFFSTGNLWENYGGAGEKWLQAGSDWYYVTLDGGIWRWDGVSGVELGLPLDGSLIATLSPTYHADPTLLIDAMPDGDAYTVTLAAGQIATDLDFGNLPLIPQLVAKAFSIGGWGRTQLIPHSAIRISHFPSLGARRSQDSPLDPSHEVVLRSPLRPGKSLEAKLVDRVLKATSESEEFELFDEIDDPCKAGLDSQSARR
jgi:hypothetical protein